MVRKINDDEAFAFYVNLGESRSHGTVARKFGVCPRAIRKASKRGNWVARLERIEKEARERMDAKLVETRAEMRERHLKMLRAITTRGLQVLQRQELDKAIDGVKALEMAIKLERIISGEPDSRTAVSVEEITRREVETFLQSEDESEEATDGDAE